MNVYEKEYSEEFIKSLPVDFYKIKNMDLSKIDEDFHCLFTTDWNWGRYSSMNAETRIIYNDIWLEYKKCQIFNISKKKKSTPILTNEDLEKEKM